MLSELFMMMIMHMPRQVKLLEDCWAKLSSFDPTLGRSALDSAWEGAHLSPPSSVTRRLCKEGLCRHQKRLSIAAGGISPCPCIGPRVVRMPSLDYMTVKLPIPQRAQRCLLLRQLNPFASGISVNVMEQLPSISCMSVP